MPLFVAPQLARLADAPPDGPDWVHEVKFDGYRIQARIEKKSARLRTRQGLDWTDRFPEIALSLCVLPDCMIDGEICALNAEGGSDFGKLQLALSEHKTAALVYFVFDCLFAGGEDLRPLPLRARKQRLESLFGTLARTPRLRFVPHFTSNGDAMLSAACRMDLEGIISKKISAPYVSGRGGSWRKAKCRGGQEVVIGAWRGDDRTLRSLLVGTFRDGRLIYMGRVGTGYGAKVAVDLLKRLRPLRRTTSPFDITPRGDDIRFVEPKLVAEIEFENVTLDGLFRQAAFKGLRLDKPAAAVVRETPQPPTREKPMAKSSTRPDDNNVFGIAITHPDKVLWPKSKLGPALTKLDLARYMAKAAERMLPHVTGRPISVVRAPDGIEGERFFQRHVFKGLAAPTLAIHVKGEAKPYLGIDTAEALVALAQQAVIEIHPWGSKAGDPETPERIIFDFDPAPDVGFGEVVKSAQDLRKRLEKLGFTPFVKTTGGKGLHVVIAVKGTAKRPITWPAAKEFARSIALAMEKDEPDGYTTTIAKKARTGKILIDYLRNDRTSTGVAPWSPRAREGAPVAVPLAWSSVNARLDPHEFTIRTAAKFLAKPDPWKDLAKTARTLPGL